MPRQNRIKTQDVVVMYTVRHWTMQQIADQVGMSKAAISKRLKIWGIKIEDGEWVRLTCDFCGKEFRRTRARWRDKIEHFCSTECYYASRENPGYHPWRQGQRLARAIVSQYFKLEQENVIHHKDDDNRNNDRANLLVFFNQSDHMKFHHGKNHVTPIWDGANITPPGSPRSS